MGAALLLPIVGGFVLYIIMKSLVRSPGRSLAAKFKRLGTLKGRAEAEIVAAVGRPSARSALAGGHLLQWQATGYHIALRFDSEAICQGVTHEHAS